ncbi:MAG TPA: hypothetical protein VLD16_04625 [Gaiellaceae bacterium]|nr:hypothetical protein [Gaiellaceae bacterium]
MRIPPSLTRFLRSAPEPEPPAETVVPPAPAPAPEADTEPEPVLALAPELEPEPETPHEPELQSPVVALALRDRTPRAWNLWELERVAEELNGDDAAAEERALLLLHMRQFADPSGDLPVEFDPLVREAFGGGLAGIAR